MHDNVPNQLRLHLLLNYVKQKFNWHKLRLGVNIKTNYISDFMACQGSVESENFVDIDFDKHDIPGSSN